MLSWLLKNPIATTLRASLFSITGHRVDGPWYTPYKFRQLTRVLKLPFDASRLPRPYGLWLDERIIECPWLLSQLPAGPATVLDAGSSLNHGFILRHRKMRQKDLTILTLAPEADCFCREHISYVYGDLRQTTFRDNWFDYVVSLSTLEHIGLDNTVFYTDDRSKAENDPEAYMAAIAELSRVLKPSGTLFLSVPFGQRSVRRWLQVFDGGMIDGIVASFRPASFSELYFRYSEPDGWQLSSREASSVARYFDYHSDTPWPGAPAAAEAIVCLALTKPQRLMRGPGPLA